jgi:plasmid stabilization system protein ParE
MNEDEYDFIRKPGFDLEDIWEFIAADNPAAADLLFTNARDYLIAYAPAEKPLWVVAVIHGRRSPRVMAAILRGRE